MTISVRNLISVVTISVAACLFLSSCKNEGKQLEASEFVPEIEVGGARLEMVLAPAGMFRMGMAEDGRLMVKGAKVHEVVLDTFAISRNPVGPDLWKEVMGSDMAGVSYDDALVFVKKLSKMTGKGFALPTEAQWEYALKLHMIPSSSCEWCRDFFVPEYGEKLMFNPEGPSDGDLRLVRTSRERIGLGGFTRKEGVGFRVVQKTGGALPDETMAFLTKGECPREKVEYGKGGRERIEVSGVSFEMVMVKGGTFGMGVDKSKDKNAGDDEAPVHQVTVSDFEIGSTEVTAGLWKAVMNSLPYGNKEPEKPVVNVSWYDCQNFILKLNSMTGRKFRLPTEAEWEYAARGGDNQSGDRFSGADRCRQVAIYLDNTPDMKVKAVGSMSPNRLGLYDMSGNAWEWCNDIYGPYVSSSQTDPKGASEGPQMVIRGGSSASHWDACRVTNRSGMPPVNIKSTFGFRLAI